MSKGHYIYIRGYNPQDCIAAAQAIRVNGKPVDSVISLDDFAVKARKLLGLGNTWDDFKSAESQIFTKLVVDTDTTLVIYTSLNQSSYDSVLDSWSDLYPFASFWVTNDACIKIVQASASFDISFTATKFPITDSLDAGRIWASESFARERCAVLNTRHIFETCSSEIGVHVIQPRRPPSLVIPTADLGVIGYRYHPKCWRWSRDASRPSFTDMLEL